MSEAVVDSLRRHPSQDRSAQRLELILDTTAELIDEIGLSAITPSLVARRAGMSGPAIYRYFSDIEGIISALARRNLERFLEAMGALLEDEQLTWEDAVIGCVDTYIGMYRDVPGFRALRLGSGPSARFSDTESNLAVVARSAIDFFQPRFEAWDRPHLVHAVEAMLQINEALITRAFDGDAHDFFICEAKRVSVQYLGEFLLNVPGIPPEGS